MADRIVDWGGISRRFREIRAGEFAEEVYDLAPAIPAESQEFVATVRGTRIGSFDGGAFVNAANRGLRLYLNVYAAPAGTTPTLDVKIQTQDSLSLNWIDLTNIAFPQISTAGLWMLVIYPGINQTTVGSTVRASDVLSRRWRLVHTIGGVGPSFDFSVAGLYTP